MKVITIRDIARLSGVSVTTVSRVLNHRPDVNEETRARVEQVMEEYHFVGNANARSLKQSDSSSVYIIIRGYQNVFLNMVVEAILRHANDPSADYVTVFIDESADEFQTAIRLCHERRPAAIVFVGSAIDKRAQAFSTIDVPSVFVTVDTTGTILSHASSVSIDDREMSYQATKYLLSLNHRRIAILGGSRKGNDVFARRFKGCMDAFHEQNVVFDPALFVPTRFSMQDALQAVQSLIQQHPDITAVFCMSDTLAIGVIRWLADAGFHVPQDVSVFGFDGLMMGDFLIPRLSTVEQPVDLLAASCVEVLQDLMFHQQPAKHVVIPAELRIRDSTSPLSICTPHGNPV